MRRISEICSLSTPSRLMLMPTSPDRRPPAGLPFQGRAGRSRAEPPAGPGTCCSGGSPQVGPVPPQEEYSNIDRK
eukprot:6003315-Pyramimonas_sp.AAC.1